MSVFAAGLLLLLGAQSMDNGVPESAVGSRLDPATRRLNNADTSHMDAAMYRFVECAVARRGGKVKRMIDTRNEAEFQSAFGALDEVQRCDVDAYVDQNTSRIMFNADRGTMRGYVAEAFIKKDLRSVSALAPLPIQQGYVRDWYPMTGRVLPINEMSACVADVDPQGIVTLLRTGIGTSGEKAAVGALLPTVGQCLTSSVQLRINELGLRTALAEALYHRAFDPATAGAAAK